MADTNLGQNSRIVSAFMKPLREHSTAMIIWGIFCVVLGTIGLFVPIAFSVGVTIFLGALLLVSGVSGLFLFWKAPGWGARTSSIILSLLTVIVGLLFLFHPIIGVESLTLFLASYFIAMGCVKGWIALKNTDAKGWGMMLFSAVVSILLGICLWWGWPASAPWIFGVFVAIELIFDGWTVLMVGIQVKNWSKNNPAA